MQPVWISDTYTAWLHMPSTRQDSPSLLMWHFSGWHCLFLPDRQRVFNSFRRIKAWVGLPGAICCRCFVRGNWVAYLCLWFPQLNCWYVTRDGGRGHGAGAKRVGSNVRLSAADQGQKDGVPDQGAICLDSSVFVCRYRTTVPVCQLIFVVIIKASIFGLDKDQLSCVVLLDSVTKQNFITVNLFFIGLHLISFLFHGLLVFSVCSSVWILPLMTWEGWQKQD